MAKIIKYLCQCLNWKALRNVNWKFNDKINVDLFGNMLEGLTTKWFYHRTDEKKRKWEVLKIDIRNNFKNGIKITTLLS